MNFTFVTKISFLAVISILSLIVVVFLFKVLGEAIHLTIEYLTSEEKVVMANSKVDALEAEGSTLRKELIAAMDGGNQMKEKIKALIDELKAEKLLMEQKDEQL